jgi:hypothetical protein
MTKPTFPDEVSQFFQETGRRGSEIHRLTPEARQLGVAVRLKKAELIRKGYSEQEALRRARVEVVRQP